MPGVIGVGPAPGHIGGDDGRDGGGGGASGTTLPGPPGAGGGAERAAWGGEGLGPGVTHGDGSTGHRTGGGGDGDGSGAGRGTGGSGGGSFGGGQGPRDGGPAEDAGTHWWQRRAGKRTLLQLGVALTSLLMLPSAWLRVEAAPYLHEHPSQVAPADVALVLGAGLVEGRPSTYLMQRLREATELYHAGTVQVVLVSGDNSSPDYNEPAVMYDYLVEHGVPADRVVQDFAGFNTWESCTRASRVFQVDEAVVITQRFHIERAITLCREAGIETQGLAAREPETPRPDISSELREIAAATSALITTWTRPEPEHLGPVEDAVPDALEAEAAGD
ncbi:SanA/YdcF family protein [Allostreptomyces psammosilenae]|uniref:Vancomycin permeability regulator SanA n=1 Tax=Allostreptomyces psammosilenae TaxID=1892865 RepID=A0A853A4Q2_9ACTN|nr:ElyC/SanA/YdcF family protein [Allostreptomyces psammosilenae]NYI08450.1 vancomycin permeability regulator SanA [Allostreptomyces psammosilenae]